MLGQLFDGLDVGQKKRLVCAFCLLVTLLVIGVDVWLAHRDFELTYSRIFGRLSFAYVSLILALTFWLGVLVGHVWMGN